MTLLQISEKLRKCNKQAFAKITEEEQNLRSEEIGEMIKIESIENEMNILRESSSSEKFNDTTVDLQIEYLEFDERQSYRDMPHVSVIKYQGAAQRFRNLAGSRYRELRIAVLGIQNLLLDDEVDQLRIKLKILQGAESISQKGKTDFMTFDHNNLRCGHFFVIQDPPTNKFSEDYLNLYFEATKKTSFLQASVKPKLIQTVSLLAPIRDAKTGEIFQLQDLLGKSTQIKGVSVPLGKSSQGQCSVGLDTNPKRSWRKSSVRKSRKD